MIIKDKLIKEYPLTKKIDCSFECFEVIKRRYVIFYDEKINKTAVGTAGSDTDDICCTDDSVCS